MVDKRLIDLDGTPDKTRLGANATTSEPPRSTEHRRTNL
jgi:hypothetical protein